MTATNPSAHPLPVASLARHLRVDRSTLWLALNHDPNAPAPVPGFDVPHYWPAAVITWWPNRRRRGQRGPDRRPRRTPPDTDAEAISMNQTSADRHAAED